MLFKGFPQPWRGWLLALSALIFALIILQFVIGGSYLLFGVVLALVAFQYWLSRRARRQL